ncbi:PREDICTED: olfactory receptor 1J4-like [Nanorana parkeri]|uniref:olfactory receptor 1J4-like n=1 Tax=Nanorana parkeri TaxID=125878 RepID=UPI000854FCD8|nr:PREDICTED: olfactory receptor 1J4-like [Nanorana parkeri]
MVFLFTITGNLLIIVLVSVTPALQSPMYYLLSHLSLSDLLISTNILPCLLGSLLLGKEIMTYSGCITQFYFFSATTISECLILSVMSYDRFLAICNPLRYSSIMDMKFCVNLSAWPWLLGFTVSLSGVLPISEFDFCADNVIDHFYCDLYPLLKLSCSDTSFVELDIFAFSMPVFIFPCGFIIVTYIYIFHTIFSIPSTTGKQKAFSTCSSHLLVVGTFYGTLIAKYMIPSNGYSLLLIKIVSLLHTVFTPLFNPIIYSLRNQDIRTALQKLI